MCGAINEEWEMSIINYFCCIFEKFVKYKNFEQNLHCSKYFTNGTEFSPEIFAKIFSFTKCNKSAIKYKDELLI